MRERSLKWKWKMEGRQWPAAGKKYFSGAYSQKMMVFTEIFS